MSNNIFTGNKTGQPLRHYTSIYRGLDPKEIAERCGLEFNDETQSFGLRVLGTDYRVPHPEFAMIDSDGKKTTDAAEHILFLRYLCEGKSFPARGRRLSYNEFPWGEVYYRNFEGRCLKRCARILGSNLPAFIKTMESSPKPWASALDMGDTSWRLEFINGLYVTIILWRADEEFPPSAQILFDDNFVFAFTAEDLAVAGEIIVERLKAVMEQNSDKPSTH